MPGTKPTREIGIRLSLGASRSSTVWLILRDSAIMVARGVALALPAVWSLGRLIGAPATIRHRSVSA